MPEVACWTCKGTGKIVVGDRQAMKVKAACAYVKRQIAKGCCVSCGVPCETNPRTTRPFTKCPVHRAKQREYQG